MLRLRGLSAQRGPTGRIAVPSQVDTEVPGTRPEQAGAGPRGGGGTWGRSRGAHAPPPTATRSWARPPCVRAQTRTTPSPAAHDSAPLDRHARAQRPVPASCPTRRRPHWLDLGPAQPQARPAAPGGAVHARGAHPGPEKVRSATCLLPSLLLPLSFFCISALHFVPRDTSLSHEGGVGRRPWKRTRGP